jgi:hypothetical protein
VSGRVGTGGSLFAEATQGIFEDVRSETGFAAEGRPAQRAMFFDGIKDSRATPQGRLRFPDSTAGERLVCMGEVLR